MDSHFTELRRSLWEFHILPGLPSEIATMVALTIQFVNDN
jgi:hypothetical protein